MTGSTANANRSRRSSLQLQPQPQREVLTPLPSSAVRCLLRWKYFVLIPIALVYLFTLSVLTNRQNLAIQLEAEGGSESNGGMLLRSSPSSQERLHSNGVTLLFDAQKRKTNEARFLPKPSASDGVATKCAFCEGERGIPNLDLVVPRTGGNTCGSIKSMAAGEMNGSDMCATLQKEENVCCPLSYSSTKTIFVISLQGTPGAHESNDGRLDLFKKKWRIACGSSSASTNIEHCPAPFDKRRGYGLTQAWIFCLWRARQLDEEAAIFLEDDARLFENSTQEFCDVNKRAELLSKLPSDTFVAFLGGHTWSYEDSAVPYRRVRNSYGTYGFLVPRNSIDDFHAALTHGLLHGSKDRKQNVHHNSLDPEPTFYRAAREYRKKIYAFNPLVIWHEGGYSNTWGKVRGNITGLETKKQGIKVSSGMTNTAHKISINSGHQRAVQEKDSKRLGGFATKCSFCEGERGIPNLDLVVPRTGGNTCGSIKSMAAGEMNESDICATLQKEENVCCPVPYVKSKALSSLDIFLNQQSIDYVPFKNGDWVAYQIRSELRLAQVFGVERGKNAITLRYLGPNTGSDRAVEKTVIYRPDLLQNHGEALLARTGTFANCSQTVENNTVVFREANERSATVVSCRTIKFAAEASSFVGKSGAVIVGVLSTSDNASWRNAIRTTWAANSTVFFVIAGSWNDIKEEYHEYKDIIWIDMQESFRLITYKTSMFFQVVNMMASELNLSYSHALKTDDDSYVALGRLKQLVKREDPKHLDYWGQSDMKYVKPLRNPEHRYYESLDQYPESYYPPYVTGSAILLSRKTVECVTKTMQEARFLDMEDVFLGVVSARCGYVPTHSKFVRVYRGSMKASRWATEHNHNKQEVTMKNKIIQHRILSPEDMVAHHESTKTDPFQFDAIPQPSSASPLDGTHELLGSLALQEMKEVESRAKEKEQ